MKPKAQRPRPRQDRAKQIAEAAYKIIETAGSPVPGRPDLQQHLGGGFSACRKATGPESFVIDIWPVPGRKLFSCDLEPDGEVSLRSFRRGGWESEFLGYVHWAVEAEIEQQPQGVTYPTGGGKTRVSPLEAWWMAGSPLVRARKLKQRVGSNVGTPPSPRVAGLR